MELGVQNRVLLTDANGNIDNSREPTIPASFLTWLKGFDKDLFVLWSPTRQRHLIHMCVEHVVDGPLINQGHTHLCRSVYVLIAQDRDGTMVPLNDRVKEQLQKMRANSEAFGGQTEQGLNNFKAYSNYIDRQMAEKREENLQDVVAHNRKDKRVQFNKLKLLMDHLFTKPNK